MQIMQNMQSFLNLYDQREQNFVSLMLSSLGLGKKTCRNN